MVTVIDGLEIINCTPHEIRFMDSNGDTVTVEPCGYTLKADPVETSVFDGEGFTLVKTYFMSSIEADEQLSALEKLYPNAVVIGSIISAQAYPMRVKSLIPVVGYERKPPQEKLYYANKFNVF